MKVSSAVLYSHVISDLSGSLNGSDSPERSAKQFSALALKDSLLKKYLEDGSTSQEADRAALELFLKTNEELLDAPLEAVDMRDQHLLGEVKASLDRFWWQSVDRSLMRGLDDLFSEGRCGPGSSLNVEDTTFYTKMFSSKFSTTSQWLYKSYSASVKTRSLLHSDAEKHRQESYGTYTEVLHNKLLFVPKRNDISRAICIEPSLNMFYQLGLASILERRLRQVYSIDLSTQPHFNRELAWQGSICGKYSTIDLSSASDSLSTGVLRAILPREMFSWLMVLRSPATKLPDGRVIPLRMISTMGNGFTFPLETIIFTAVVEAAYRVCGIPLKRNRPDTSIPGNFAVFGDDIIVRRETFSAVIRLLSLLGFKVNSDKTFDSGPFRESCGGDYFAGKNVRGVYIKTLKTPQDRYVAINQLIDWTAQTGIYLPKAVQYLVSTVKWVTISPLLGLDQGIHLPSGMATFRYNMNGSFKFRAYYPRALTISVKENGSFSGGWRARLPNESGLELSFLAGYIRSSRISLRQRGVRYSMKTCTLPVWDELQFVRSYRRFSFTQWETAAFYTLFK